MFAVQKYHSKKSKLCRYLSTVKRGKKRKKEEKRGKKEEKRGKKEEKRGKRGSVAD